MNCKHLTGASAAERDDDIPADCGPLARLLEAERLLRQHEAAVAWCVRHGLDPNTVTYAEVSAAGSDE
jgi:hypothetical protein